jgi:hypothetical protein
MSAEAGIPVAGETVIKLFHRIDPTDYSSAGAF